MLRYGLWLFLMTAMLQTGGCAIAPTLDAISPGEEEDEFDFITDVKAAWRDEAGNVILSVYGLPAGANAWLAEGRNYCLVYPAASSPRLEIVYHETIPRYRVTAGDVKGACASAMSGTTRIPVQRIDADEFGDTDYCRMSEDALAAFFSSRAEAPAVYMFNHSFGTETSHSHGMKAVYVHEAPIFKDARAVEIATDPRRIESRPAYILLLPFALTLDLGIVAYPVSGDADAPD